MSFYKKWISPKISSTLSPSLQGPSKVNNAAIFKHVIMTRLKIYLGMLSSQFDDNEFKIRIFQTNLSSDLEWVISTLHPPKTWHVVPHVPEKTSLFRHLLIMLKNATIVLLWPSGTWSDVVSCICGLGQAFLRLLHDRL